MLKVKDVELATIKGLFKEGLIDLDTLHKKTRDCDSFIPKTKYIEYVEDTDNESDIASENNESTESEYDWDDAEFDPNNVEYESDQESPIASDNSDVEAEIETPVDPDTSQLELPNLHNLTIATPVDEIQEVIPVAVRGGRGGRGVRIPCIKCQVPYVPGIGMISHYATPTNFFSMKNAIK